MTQSWRLRERVGDEAWSQCHWCGTSYSAGWFRCIMPGCHQNPVCAEGMTQAYQSAMSAAALSVMQKDKNFPEYQGDKKLLVEEQTERVHDWFLTEWSNPIERIQQRTEVIQTRRGEAKEESIAARKRQRRRPERRKSKATSSKEEPALMQRPRRSWIRCTERKKASVPRQPTQQGQPPKLRRPMRPRLLHPPRTSTPPPKAQVGEATVGQTGETTTRNSRSPSQTPDYRRDFSGS